VELVKREDFATRLQNVHNVAERDVKEKCASVVLCRSQHIEQRKNMAHFHFWTKITDKTCVFLRRCMADFK